MPATVTARPFVKRLETFSSPDEAEKLGRFFRGSDDGSAADNRIMGVPFGKVFAVAREFMQAPLGSARLSVPRS